MHVRMYVCMYVSFMYICMCVCMYFCMFVSLSACLPAWLAVCLSVYLYVCMYVCMYVRIIEQINADMIKSANQQIMNLHGEDTTIEQISTDVYICMYNVYPPMHSYSRLQDGFARNGA